MTGQQPDVSHFHPLGLVCWVQKSIAKRTDAGRNSSTTSEWLSKQEICLFLGYMNASSKTFKVKTFRGKGAIIHSKYVTFMKDSRDPRKINPVLFEYNMADTRVWAENEDSSKSVSLESIIGQCPYTDKGLFLTDKDLKEKLLVYV